MKVLSRAMNAASESGCTEHPGAVDKDVANDHYLQSTTNANISLSEPLVLAEYDELKQTSIPDSVMNTDADTVVLRLPTPDQVETVTSFLSHQDLASIAAMDKVVHDDIAKRERVLSSDLSGDRTESSSQEGNTISLQQSASDDGISQYQGNQIGESPFIDSQTAFKERIPPNESSIPASSKSKAAGTLRRGKWTAEEESYVARVIQDFNSGYLNAPAGTTLRTYLSEKLKCDPMRITKKFTGEACIGKRVFHPAVRSISNAAFIDKAQAELDVLERRWRRRLEMQQRESFKKTSVSVAAVTAATSGAMPYAITSNDSTDASIVMHGNPVATTAAWLDRAKNVLKDPSSGDGSTDDQTQELENQMQEVQRLIYEGPSIRQTSHALPQILDNQVEVTASTESQMNESFVAGGSDDEQAEKRLRTAEDAEALVGFLRSVRASAAQGEIL